jgi:hypothetical protein
MTGGLSPIQVKPHRLLNKEQHIQFFYKNQIVTSRSSVGLLIINKVKTGLNTLSFIFIVEI